MSMRDRIDRMLDRLPGYAGYRDKERRRDSDRAIRDKLVVDYGQLNDRLGRLATQLANARKLEAVAVVDRPVAQLRSFLDRVRTATYGYAPIFSNDEVDATVLDQIAAFDTALADRLSAVEREVTALEAADPEGGDFKDAANRLSAEIQQLADRFGKRDELIHSGRPLPEKDLLVLLGPATPDKSPVVWRLQTGDAVSHAGIDYSIVGRITAELAQGARRAFQLRGGDDRSWLEAGETHGSALFWLTESAPSPAGQDGNVTVGNTSYRRQSDTHARGEVEGRQGIGDGPLRYLEYAAGDRVLHVYDWGAQQLALEGVAIDERDIELYTGQR